MLQKSPPNEAECLVYTVPEAGAMIGLTKNGSYAAAKRGEIPTIKIGRLYKVPKAAFHAKIEAPLGRSKGRRIGSTRRPCCRWRPSPNPLTSKQRITGPPPMIIDNPFFWPPDRPSSGLGAAW